MRKHVDLQAHRGVGTEFPENTMAAFKAAIKQQYEYIELDPDYTSDYKIVVMHDAAINRTARNSDGSPIQDTVNIENITYEEALKYDFGIYFAPKFKGERIPLLRDVLSVAKENGVIVKIDCKVERFSKTATEKLYELLQEFESGIALTSGKVEMIKFYAEKFPLAQLHYDGAANIEALEELSQFSNRLTIWMPFKSKLTDWVKIPFVDDKLSKLVKKYGKLGIWNIGDDKSYDFICENYKPDIVETTGYVKPVINEGMLCDMHTHSQNSHDSKCPVRDMAISALQKGISAFAITDHCDIQYYVERDMPSCISASVNETVEAAKEFDKKIKILKGIEIGEGIWNGEYSEQILNAHNYDVVVGSVHAVRYKNYTMPYSTIDFSLMTQEQLHEYVTMYFNEVFEMLNKVPCDVMAHFTCPFYYINGKYNRNLDTKNYKEQIRKILKFVIDHAISMEINTSRIGTNYNRYQPDKWIIREFKDMGGHLITLGSDAHLAEGSANAFEDTAKLLKEIGFNKYYYYENRIDVQCWL